MTGASPEKRSYLGNFSSYAVGNALGLLAGLVSFPLFTRTLSVSEYGALSLLNAALSLLACFSKAGIQNSINRFWVAGGDNGDLVGTSYSGVIACFLLVTLVSLPGFCLGWFGPEYARFSLLVLAACYLTVLFEVLRSVSNNISIIRKDALHYSLLNCGHKYLRILFPYLGLLICADRMFGIAAGFLAASVISAALLFQRQKLAWRLRLERRQLSSLLVFSLPLMLNELIDYCLTFCGRFFLVHHLGASSVGVYSAAYNLSNNLQVVLITSMGMTTAPILLERFNAEGFESMKSLLRRCISWYCLLGGGMVALAASVGPDLLLFLASSKYQEAAGVMLPILSGVFLYGLYGLATSTLFFRNQTRTILSFCLAAAVINVLANWLLVPRIGIMGAALATLASHFFLGTVGATLAYGGRTGELLNSLARLVPALLMMLLVNLMVVPDHLLSLVLKSGAGLALWSLFSYAFFAEVRAGVASLLQQARDRWVRVRA